MLSGLTRGGGWPLKPSKGAWADWPFLGSASVTC